MENKAQANSDSSPGLVFWLMNMPLYVRILAAIIIALPVGVLLGDSAGVLATPAKLVLRLLGALAPALILLAIIKAVMTAHIEGRDATRLVKLLLLNTLVAILIGLFVANLIQPGVGANLSPQTSESTSSTVKANPLMNFLDNIPKSLLGPLGDDGKVISVIFIALAFGIALREQRQTHVHTVEEWVELLLSALIKILHWVITLVPFAVFAIIASIIGTKGFADFKALGMFVLSVILALCLQSSYYLLRVRFSSWVSPSQLLNGCKDALIMAFSTASSTITMPVTYACLKDKVGLREQSASMGALIGANFNNDGTALYEAMAALFIAQMVGIPLGLPEQILVVITSVIASIGAAGIPEAGLVTMTLVFNAVGLPVEYIAILLTVDWFLDRCRTAINVMGDINISCILDGKLASKTRKV